MEKAGGGRERMRLVGENKRVSNGGKIRKKMTGRTEQGWR